MIPLLPQWQNHKGAAHLKQMTLHPLNGAVLAGSGFL